MYASHDPIHYFIVRKNPPAQAVPDLILSEEGAVNVTAEDLDFSGRTFRLLASPFQKACFAMAHAEPDQVPDVVRALRKAYPGLTQVISPRVRSGRKTVSDYGTLPKEDRQVFQGFLEAMGISPEKFILDPACLVVIDGPEDILGHMIRNGLFDIDGVETRENLHDPELMEKYVTD